VEDGAIEIGAIHTYVELYARLLVDLSPNVALICAEQGDRKGNLYTVPNTDDTPVIAEAAAFRGLVDRRGSGAQNDLSFDLMKRSATVLQPFF
jgi:malonate decarboxylase alpha subunit